MNVLEKATNWLADLQTTELVLLRELAKVKTAKGEAINFIEMYHRFESRSGEQTEARESPPPAEDTSSAPIPGNDAGTSSGPAAPEVRDTLASATRLPGAGPETILGNDAEAAENEVEVALVAPSSAQPTPPDGITVAAASEVGVALEADLADQEPAGVTPADTPTSGAATRKDADSPAPEPTLKQRVKRLHAEHPEYTRKQAREALGISEGNLDGTSHVLGIKWAPAGIPQLAPNARLDPITPDETVTDIIQARPKAKAGQLFWLRDSDGQYLNRYCSAMTRNRKEAWTGTEAQIMGCRRNYKIARDLREMPVEKEKAVI